MALVIDFLVRVGGRCALIRWYIKYIVKVGKIRATLVHLQEMMIENVSAAHLILT